MAANKKAIRSVVYKGYATIADSYVSPALQFWYNPEVPKWDYNIKAARGVLAKAGYEWDADGRLLYPKGKVETLVGK